MKRKYEIQVSVGNLKQKKKQQNCILRQSGFVINRHACISWFSVFYNMMFIALFVLVFFGVFLFIYFFLWGWGRGWGGASPLGETSGPLGACMQGQGSTGAGPATSGMQASAQRILLLLASCGGIY